MFVFVSFDRFRLQALEHCLCAGEPINPEVMWKWKDLTGLNIYEGYGQTETVRLIRFFVTEEQHHSEYCFPFRF